MMRRCLLNSWVESGRYLCRPPFYLTAVHQKLRFIASYLACHLASAELRADRASSSTKDSTTIDGIF
jgi:hypothetical protein